MSVVVEDLPDAIEFFTALGMTLEGQAPVQGETLDRLCGLEAITADIAMMRTPDGHSRVEPTTYRSPALAHMSQADRYRKVHRLSLGILLVACSAWHNQAFAQTAEPSDTAEFAAVLRALDSDTSYTVRPIVADPRPLLGDDSIMSSEPSSYAPVTGVELLARRTVMRQLGIETGDASFPAWCAGLLVPAKKSSDPAFAGCPSTGRVVVAIAHPRVGDRTRNATDVDPRWRTVRVIIAGIGPEGISAEIRDYVVERTGDAWTVAKWKRIGFWE